MIKALTGLRAIAALMVFLFHAAGIARRRHLVAFPGADGGIVHSGDFGVDVFFVLSGFVIAYVYGARLHPFSASAYRKFIWFRIARLAPTHYATMGLMLATYFASRGMARADTANAFEFSSFSVAANLLLVQEWLASGNFIARLPLVHAWLASTGGIGSPNSVSWSISAEFLAYLAFPALLWATRRFDWRLWTVLLAVAGLGLGSLHLLPADNLVRVLFCFTGGLLLHRAASRHQPSAAPGRHARDASGLLIAASLGVMLDLFRSANGGLPYVACVVLVALLIFALCNPGDLLGRALAGRTMVYLGEISYSFYMLHWFVLKAGDQAFARFGIGRPDWACVATLAELVVTTLMAAALYRFLEHPARDSLQAWYLRRGRGEALC